MKRIKLFIVIYVVFFVAIVLSFDNIPRLQKATWGFCGRCRKAWGVVESHPTHYKEVPSGFIGTMETGCVALCNDCWNELTPKGRLPFYRRLVNSWSKDEERWKLIKTAVLEGK